MLIKLWFVGPSELIQSLTEKLLDTASMQMASQPHLEDAGFW